MRYAEVDLIGGFYADDTLPWSAQDCVNYLPTVAEQRGTRTQAMLKTPPGLSYFTQCGEGPIRGARDVEGKLFVVSGNELYEVAFDGTPTLRGTIPGTGLVSMAHNKRGYGNQLLVVNGDAGYVWDTTGGALTKITDDGYPGAVMVDYLDHYLIQVEPFGRFWFHSNLDNALDYNTLDRYDPEASPDKIIGIAANQLEAVSFSQRTIEFFTDTGAATGTFQSKRIVIERGCASRHTIVKLDNTLMWLGNDGIFYRLNGYGAQPISTGPIHRAIAGLDWSRAFGFTWEDKGYKVAYWTFPDGQTWGYDATQPPGFQWHRRQSFGMDRWRLNTCTLWQRRWVGGDYRHGLLYLLDWDAQHEVGAPMVSERTGPAGNANQNLVQCAYVELLFATGGESWDGETGTIPPVIVDGDLPDGVVGDSGTYSYTAADGVAPYTFSLLSGSLPPGAALGADGVVTYSYTLGGSYSWTVRVTDAVGGTADQPDTATITVQPMILAGSTGAVAVVIQSPDGLDFSAPPVITGGNANNLNYLTALADGRYFGRALAGAVKGGYTDNDGAAWTLTAANVTSGAYGDAYTNATLFLPAHAGNYLKSVDNGETFTDGGIALGRFVALNRTEGKLAALGTSMTILRESTDTGATWSTGVSVSSILNFSSSSGGCQGTDGEAYYYGASSAAIGGVPRLARCIGGVLTQVTLPTLTGATGVTAFAYGNGVKVIGTDNGKIAYDDGSGFVDAGVTLASFVRQLKWCGSHFIAVCSPTGGGPGAIYTSPNGQAPWTQRSLAGSYALFTVAQKHP